MGVLLVSILIYSAIFGVVTYLVIKNKDYQENWFWWGFLFGIFALVVACAKPPKILYDIEKKLARTDWADPQERREGVRLDTLTLARTDWVDAQEKRAGFVKEISSYSLEKLQTMAENKDETYSEDELKCIRNFIQVKKDNG